MFFSFLKFGDRHLISEVQEIRCLSLNFTDDAARSSWLQLATRAPVSEAIALPVRLSRYIGRWPDRPEPDSRTLPRLLWHHRDRCRPDSGPEGDRSAEEDRKSGECGSRVDSRSPAAGLRKEVLRKAQGPVPSSPHRDPAPRPSRGGLPNPHRQPSPAAQCESCRFPYPRQLRPPYSRSPRRAEVERDRPPSSDKPGR